MHQGADRRRDDPEQTTHNRKILNDFVRHALDLSPRVIMLAKLQFLAGVGRSDILERRGLARVHVFRDRLDMMHRADWTGNKATQAISHAWFCWDRNHRGPATFHRITFDKPKATTRARGSSAR